MEILVPQPCPETLRTKITSSLPETCLISEKDRSLFEPGAGEAWLCRRWNIPSLRAFGLDDGDPAAGAACAVLLYFEETQFGLSRHVMRLYPLSGGGVLRIDGQSQKNLELLDFGPTSLFGVLNRCRTPMGKRTLRDWILRPLLDLDAIRLRQDAVEWLKDDPKIRARLADSLQRCRDLERILGRLSLNLGSPLALAAIRETLSEVPSLLEIGRDGPLATFLAEVPELSECLEDLMANLADNPNRSLKDGGIIRPGADPQLDEWRNLAGQAEGWLSDYMARERERTGIPNLKVGNNRVFGYYIEIPRS
jgi:DNA mismatch repair protein MutS